jgi:type IV pilus assembly protein PilB
MIEFEGQEGRSRSIEFIRVKEEEEATQKIAEQLHLSYANLQFRPIEREALLLVPESKARKAKLAVIFKRGDSLAIALQDPDNSYAKEILQNLQKQYPSVSLLIVSLKSLEHAWSFYSVGKGVKKITGQVAVSAETLKNFQEKITTIVALQNAVRDLSEQKDVSKILELLLASALRLNASDIHIEPRDQIIGLRLRIDGIMQNAGEFDLHTYRLLLSRVKLLSSMKLNIHNIAQDGRFSVELGELEIQIRSSILPGEYGENVVLRILNPASLMSIANLGIREDLLSIVEEQIKKPNGLILTTGPTGSGKTTTLYAFLKKLKAPEVKIITVEDPIEYHLEGISQTQVAAEHGYTFASGLRSILRQDPDVILVGEIRDLETADTALQAALTGHLVFSTLHTNDAAGVVPRLSDIGANPVTIGPALNMAIAQRLIRRLCKKCKTIRKANEKELVLLEHVLGKVFSSGKIKQNIDKTTKIPEAKGCAACGTSGYKGRVGVYEILTNNPEFEKFILNNPSITEIQEFAQAQGMITLKQDGFLKVLEGTTTIEEVERVVGE